MTSANTLRGVGLPGAEDDPTGRRPPIWSPQGHADPAEHSDPKPPGRSATARVARVAGGMVA
ncbi:hypothetical protein JOD67_002425 [Tenggerimyces flavus]|nr:hypothetical protein [Tenggerimyces flavus]